MSMQHCMHHDIYGLAANSQNSFYSLLRLSSTICSIFALVVLLLHACCYCVHKLLWCSQEEIDEEALPCLTVQDLRSLGITNAAHQRLILSAAMQPATQTVARPASTAHPAHLPASPVNVTVPSATHSRASVSSANSTSDVLPIRALPAGGLHSIAAAVASRQSKTAGSGTSALFRAAWPSVPQYEKGALFAAASQPRAAAAIAGAVAPSKGAGIIKGTSKPAGSTAKPAAAAPTVKAITSATMPVNKAALPVNKAAGLLQSNKANPGVKGVAKPAVAAFDSSKPAAVAFMAGLAAASCAEPTVSKHKKATAASSGRAVEAEKGSSTLAAAATSKGAAVPAPRSKADEARQLAMALSASMGADTGESVSEHECTACYE
jgi:hypothetical protein